MPSQAKSKLHKNTNIFAAVVITATVLLAIASFWNDSIVVDEVPHIGAGYSYLVKQDMRLNPEHPPLAKDLAAVPLLFANLKKDAFTSNFWQKDVSDQWNFGRLLIFNSGNNAELIKHLTKLPMLLFFILSAILIFKWARKLYGDTGAITALILFSFSPTILAHSRFVTTDMPALFGVLSATYFFVRYIKAPSNKGLILSGLVFGAALLLKFSTFLLMPFFVILALIYGLTKNPSSKNSAKLVGSTILSFVIGFIFIVWPVYYFHVYNYPPEKQRQDTQYLLKTVYGDSYTRFSPALDTVVKMSDKPLVRPFAQYMVGFLRVAHQGTEPHDVYFLGDIYRYGSHKYFPIVYFIKEPLPWWGLVLISLIFLAWQWRHPFREWLKEGHNFFKKYPDEFAMILWLSIYWAVSLNSTLNIGVRHLLSTYPFAILLVSGQISRIRRNLKLKAQNFKSKLKTLFLVFNFLIFALLGWYVYENLHVFPYYLTYFNQAVGGPSGGYKYVVDSNLDWGQDLVRFSDWVKENNIPKIEFDYFGWADPSYYLKDRYIWSNSSKFKDANDFKAHGQSNGWMAVSATFLQNAQGQSSTASKINYLWLNSYEPATVIGNSIFVYHIK